MDHSQYRLIYEYYASRARYGYFKKGDILPSNSQLCAQFHVTRQTVRKAFTELQKDGYISVSPGRNSVIVYDVPEEVIQKSILDYYLTRKTTMLDLNETMMVMLNPLLEEGCRRMQGEDMELLYSMACNTNTELSAISLGCSYTMLEKLDNPLVIDFYNEAVLYYQFPCFQKALDASNNEFGSSREIISKIKMACKSWDRTKLLESFFLLQHRYHHAMQDYLYSLPEESPLLQQVPFRWRVYRDRPQYCYTLVSQLIGKVAEGSYKEGDFLPSFGVMSREYNVSLSTVRRSIDILNALGMSETLNGLGTQIILSEPDMERLRRPVLLKNFDILFHSIQIATLTCDSVVSGFYPIFTQEQKNTILEGLLHIELIGDLFKLLFTTIMQLFEQYPLSAVQEIGFKIYEFLLWGYPFIRSFRIDKVAAGAMDLIKRGLECNDAGVFSQGIKEMLEEMGNIIKIQLSPKF